MSVCVHTLMLWCESTTEQTRGALMHVNTKPSFILLSFMAPINPAGFCQLSEWFASAMNIRSEVQFGVWALARCTARGLFLLSDRCGEVCVAVTQRWVLQGAVHRQDVLVNQFDGTRSVGDLVVEVVGQSSPLQLQLLGLQGGFCWCLCGQKRAWQNTL